MEDDKDAIQRKISTIVMKKPLLSCNSESMLINAEQLRKWTESTDGPVNLVLTTGGTGFGVVKYCTIISAFSSLRLITTCLFA